MPCKRYYDALKNGHPDNKTCPIDKAPCLHLDTGYPWYLCAKPNKQKTEEELKEERELLIEQRVSGKWEMNGQFGYVDENELWWKNNKKERK